MITVKLPFKVRKPLLACGADLKGAFALAVGGEAYIEEGFGDLADPDNLCRYERSVSKSKRRLGIKPEAVICDLHPGYQSTRFAEEYAIRYPSCPVCKIQHHEAHIASCIIDNGIKGDVIGVAFDGTGYGADGNIWGGEFFTGNFGRLRRTAHLEYLPMPGGEAAIRQPWRMAASYLYRSFGNRPPKTASTYLERAGRGNKWPLVKKAIDRGINSPLTSSAGRLFDAVSSIVLNRHEAGREAELPMELERRASAKCDLIYDYEINSKGGLLVIGLSALFKAIMKDIAGKTDIGTISSRFHDTVADIILDTCRKLKGRTSIKKVVLSGGVFQNKLLTLRAKEALRRGGFDVYTHSLVRTNDYGIPIGQIAIAAARGSCA